MKKILVLYIIGILVLSSIISVGIFYFINQDNTKDIDDKDDTTDGDNGLSDEVKEKWRAYSDTVDSPEIITVDPGIVKVEPGDPLEKMVELEGMYDFADTSQGTMDGNLSQSSYNERYDEPVYVDDMDSDNTAVPGDEKVAEDGVGAGEGETREVEEADLVKVIDDTLFVLNSYRGLITIDISDPENAYIAGQCSVVGYPIEMYVVDFLAIITVNANYNFWYKYWALEEGGGLVEDTTAQGTIGTMIYIVNVDDPAEPKILKIVELEGYASESRRVGHVVYQATNTYSYYYYYDDNNENKEETIVTSINFGDPETVGKYDQVRFEGNANQVHASPTAFYVAQPKYNYDDNWTPWSDYEYYTEVTYLDISDPDGDIEQKDSFNVPGYLEDKYQMDEYNKMFRIVTHFWTGIGESKLYIFDVSNPDDIERIGSLLIDDAGSLMATRFAGERAYTIHLPRAVDPLDVLDLSNPTDPKLCDVFEMPGWVTHMEVRGMKIIALGVDDSEGQRNVAVSLFDVTDPYNAKMLDRERLGGDYAYSAANWEPKALTIDDTHNIVVVPYSSYDYDTWESINGVQLVHFDLEGGELTLKGSAYGAYSIERTRVVGDYVLATSFKTLQVVDITSLDEPEVVKILELCVNVEDIIPMGDYYLQMTQDWNYRDKYGNDVSLRSVTDADDLGAVDTETWIGYWGKLFQTPNGVIFVVNKEYDDKSVARIYKVTIDSEGKIKLENIGQLPDGVLFYDYTNYYYYDYGMEDAVGVRSLSRDMVAPYYYGGGSGDKFITTEDALIYYHVGRHPYSDWVYNETAQKYMPTPEKKGEDTLYIFDISGSGDADLSSTDLEAYSFNGLACYQDTLYVQHRMYDVSIWNESKYYYYNSYYKNYAMAIDISDLSKPEVTGDYNIPGSIVGAGDGLIYTQSDWYDEDNNVTLNTLTIQNDTAVITSAVKIGTGYVEVMMQGSKAYIVDRDDYYYYYYYRDYDDTAKEESSFSVIDLSNPDKPKLDLSATFEGNIDLVSVGYGHVVFYNSYQSSLMVYKIDTNANMYFEALILVQGGYNNLRIYENTLLAPQGYYSVIEAELAVSIAS